MPPETEISRIGIPWTPEEELARGDEMFRLLQLNGIQGDVASWLVKLAIRVRRLEAKANLLNPSQDAKEPDMQPLDTKAQVR